MYIYTYIYLIERERGSKGTVTPARRPSLTASSSSSQETGISSLPYCPKFCVCGDFGPFFASQLDNSVVPTTQRSNDPPTRNNSQPRAPLNQSLAPAQVCACNDFASQLPSSDTLKHNPIFATVFCKQPFTFRGCSLDVFHPVLVL